MTDITTATDARSACDAILLELQQLPWNADLRKLLKNLDSMVTEISRKEVIARRTKHGASMVEPLQAFNKALNHLNNLILMARLMQ